MIKISREELLKLAKLSGLSLDENEIPLLIKDLEDVLTYAARVKDVASNIEIPSNKNINVFREDVVVSTDPKDILNQAPEKEADLFVVPKIIEKD